MDTFQPLQPDLVLKEQYQIDSLQGQGPFGLVYLATDIKTNCPVALKEMQVPQGDYKQEVLEALTAATSLKHPNIASVFDYFEQDGRFFVVMEWFDGDSLNNALTYQTLSIAKKYFIIQQLIDALRYAEHMNQIHGSICLDNIMIDKQGRALIVDFGLSPTKLDSAMDIDTVEYLAPEVLKKKGKERHDWYALGVVIYHLLNNKSPFNRSSINALYESKLRKSQIFKYNQFANTSALISKLLAPYAEERLTNVEQIQAEFDRALHLTTPSFSIRRVIKLSIVSSLIMSAYLLIEFYFQ